MMKEVSISTENITLGQLLKLAGVIDTGGAVKSFLSENEVLVNGIPENRRGKKLYHDDEVVIKGIGNFKVVSHFTN